MSKQLNIDVNLNTAKASAQLKSLTSQIQEAINSSNSKGTLTREIVSATEAATKLKTILNSSMNSKGNLDLSKFSANLKSSGTSLTQYAQQLNNLGSTGQQAFMNMAKQIATAQAPLKQTNTLTTQLFTSLKNTARWQLSSAVLHGVVNTFQNAFSYAKGLNESLNSIRIVTGLSANEMDKFAKAANTSAKALSASTLDYTDAALIYYQQGIRDQKQIKERTDATIKMANVTGDSAAKVSNQLTAIWNNFAKGGDNLEYYADVITALGAATASSSAEISAGLEKFASIAEETGLSYEYATSSLATIVATTRQSADVVGTALKTIFGRVQSLNLGETLDDGTTLGKYSKALSQVGINIKDQNGQLKDMDNILDEMGAKWQGLNRDQRVALAQSVAGARQYNQLMALMENYDFFKENVAIAKGSEGELTKQADIYAESWQAARDRVKASWQGILDDVISDKFFIGLNNVFAGLLDNVNKFTSAIGGMPGVLGLVGAAFTKVFQKPINNGINNLITSVKTFKKDYVKEQVALQKDLGASVSAITPRKDSPQSDIIQTNNLKQSITLSTAYAQKMQAIIQSGKTISNQDKVRITTLQDMVNLYSELELKAQQQVEAEQATTETIQARIAAQAESRAISSTTGSQGAQIMAGINAKEESEKLTNTAIQSYRTALMGQAGLKSIRNGFDLSSEMRSNLGNLAAQALTRISPTIQSSLTYEDFISKYGFRLNGKNLPRNISSKDLFTQFVAGTLDNKYEVWEKEKRGAITPFTKRYTGSYNDMVNQSLNPAYAAAQRSEKFFSSNRFDRVAKHVSDAYKAGVYGKEVQDLTAAEKKVYDKSQKALKYIDQRAKDLDFQGTEKYMSTAVIAAAKNGKHGAELRQAIENEVNALYQKETTGQIKNASIKELTQQIQNLNGQEINKGFSNAAMGVANLSIGISSLVSGFKALNDESMSFGDKLLQTSMSFGMAIPMLTTGIGSMATNIPKMVKGISNLTKTGLLKNTLGYSAAIAAGGTEAGMAFVGDRNLRNAIGARIAQSRYSRFAEKQLAANAGITAREISQAYVKKYGAKDFDSGALGNAKARKEQVEQIKQGTGKGTGAAAAGGLSMLQVVGIVAALAALAVLVAKVKKELYDASLEGQLEKATAEGEQLTSALEEAQSAAEGLKSAFDSYHGIADTLSKCTTGTQEWSEALRENNNEVLSLMSQYPELAKIQGAIQKNADGSLSISKEAEQEMNTIAQNRIDTLSWAKLANAETQQMLKDQLDIQAKGREMAQLMESGKDVKYWRQGEVYKTETKTSAFDTDLSGAFYKTGAEGGISDLHAYEKTHETSVGANQLANEALIKNWGDLQALSGEQLTSALSDVFAKNNLGVSSDDLAKYSAAVESSTYRDELTKLYNQQKTAQEAFETSQIGVMSNKLASEGILDNDSKTRDLISNIFGKQLDERTKTAVEDNKQKYASSKSERQRLAEEYVAAMGGDINSISFNNSGELSYLDSAGQKIEGITGAMVASVTGAASALDQLAGSAEAAAGAMQAIPMTQGGDAIRDFLANEDFSKTSASDLREVLKNVVSDDEGTYDANVLSNNLIKAMGGIENAQEIAAMLGKELPDLIADMTTDLVNQNEWLNSAERAASIEAFEKKGVDRERLENYSRAELEARQNYEDSRLQGPVKSLQELQTMAEAAGEAQQYLNRSWEDGTRLSAEQAAGIKDIVQNQDLYNMAIDENTGKIKDAQLLQELLGNTIDDVGKQALRSQQPLYEQLDQAYKKLQENQLNPDDKGFLIRQENLLSELDLLDQEIAKYRELALVSSGALQAYDKIAKGKEYDEANDYTDELEGALGSIYSHIEKDSNGNYKWDTLQSGSREVQAAIEALIPEDVRTGKNREGITVQQYLRDMYGDGKVGGRYRDKDGNITKANVDNFVNDMLGKSSSWGTYSGFLEGREGYSAEDFYSQGFSKFLDGTKQGSRQQQGTIQEAAASMHMTESSFISMLSAAEKYNTSGESYLSQFTADGSDLAIQLQLATEQIKTSTEAAIEARKKMNESEKGSKEYQDAEKQYTKSIQEQTQAILEQKKAREQAHDVGAKYAALQKQLESGEGDSEAIAKQMAEIQAEHPEIEVYLSFVTDEANIQDIQQTIQEAMDSGAEGLGDLSVDAWSGIADNIASSINQDGALDALFENFDFSQFEGDATKAIESIKTQLPQMFDTFNEKGLGNKLKDYITQAVKDASEATGEEDLLGADSINGDELANAARDATQQAVDAAQEVADSNPIKLTYESEKDNKDDTGGTSSYTGSSTNDPQKEGFTEGATNKGGKGAVQSKSSNPKITVELDTTQAQANLDAFTASIASIPATIPLSISGNITDVSDHIATLSGLLATLGGNVPALTITTNSTTIDTQLDNTKTKAEALSQIKPKIMIQCNANSINRSVSNLASNLRSLKSPPPIHISITHDPLPTLPGVVPPAFGTARAYGSAFAKGQWGTGTGPVPALVGELGQELVVDPATGRFYTVGDAGAEFTTLPKNAIVFNHKQTAQLLKYRKINSRGQAMAEGNANQVKGLAFAAGTDETVQYQEKMLTIIRNEVDLFKEIEYQLSKINHELKNVQRNVGRLAGRDAFENIEKTIQKLNELYKENLHARDYAVENNKLDKQALNSVLIQWEQQKEHSSSKAGERKYNTERAEQVQDAFKFLETYGKLSSDAYKRDANGVVTEYDKYAVEHALKEMARNAEITYNSAVKSETLTQQQQVEAENAYNYIMAGVEAIGTAFSNEQDTAEKIWEYTENSQDNLEEMHDLEMQRIKEEFELRKQLANNDIKRVELIMKRLDNNFFKRAEKLSFMFDKDHMFEPTNWAKNGTHTELGDRIKLYHAAIKQFEDAKADLEKAQAERGYADPHAVTEQAFMDLSQASINELADFEEYLIDLIDTMRTYFADTLEQASSELEKYTDQMGHYVSVLDHMSNLMDLLGRKFDFDSKETIIRGQINGLKNDLKVRTQMFEELDKNREEAEKHLAEHAAEYSKEAYENEYNNLVLPSIQAAQEAEEKKYEAAEAYLEKLEALYQNAFDRINAEWEKLGTQGQGWDYLTSAMERAKAIQDEYLTTTNKLYETNTLMRKVQNDINKTDSSVSKEKLMNFNKEIEAAQQNDKLAKSSMEILKARYELLQAEMALEDAKNAKSTVRLQRDNEGNYGYVYTADQDDINDKEQDFADKQNDLYNLVLGYQNDYQEKSMQAMQEFQTKWMELEQQRKDGLIASDTELYAKQKELKAQYKEIFDAYNISMTESEQWLNKIAAEGVSEAWAKSWEDRRGNLTDFMGFSKDAHTELNGYLKEMNDVRNEVVKDAKLGMDDVNKKVQELTTKSNILKTTITETVIPAIGDEIGAVRDLTTAFDEQYDHLGDLIDQVHNYLNAMSQAQVDLVGKEYQDDIYDQDFSSLDLQARLAGDHSGSNLVTRDKKIELYNMQDSVQNSKDVGAINEYLSIHANKNDKEFIQKAASTLYRITKEDGINFANMSDKEKDQYVFWNIANKGTSRMATGGYTGEWGPEGKIAILHEKELVLNKDDTSNLLEALKIAKENYMQSIQTQRLQSLYEQQMIASTEQFTSAAFQNNTDSLQQEVTIHAEFPNVTERNEIAEAFKTLVNEASQFANRY